MLKRWFAKGALLFVLTILNQRKGSIYEKVQQAHLEKTQGVEIRHLQLALTMRLENGD